MGRNGIIVSDGKRRGRKKKLPIEEILAPAIAAVPVERVEASPEEDEFRETWRDLAKTARAISEQMAALAFPPEFDIETLNARGDTSRYTPIMHARACRYTMLGMDRTGVARAIGVAPRTLDDWTRKFPKFEIDIGQAAELSNALMMVLLRRFTLQDNATGFSAVKFTLESRTKEFKPRQTLEVAPLEDGPGLARQIREQIYGLKSEADPPLLETEAPPDAGCDFSDI